MQQKRPTTTNSADGHARLPLIAILPPRAQVVSSAHAGNARCPAFCRQGQGREAGAVPLYLLH